MREILFRGKRVDNGEWVYGGIVHQTDYYGYKVDKWFIIDGTTTDDEIGEYYEVIPETVGQYTGSTVEGKKIFEGDIAHICIDYGPHLGNIVKRDTGVVVSKELQGYLVDCGSAARNYSVGWADSVYGNIYDSPEFFEEDS